MIKLVTAAQMRLLEQRAEMAGTSVEQLMENAGLATAQEAWMLLGTLEDRIIVVLVGPGNNGGDGLVAARHLFDWGAEARVYLSRRRVDDANLRQIEERGVPIVSADEDPGFGRLQEMLVAAHLIVDALLGTGQSRPIAGTIAEILERVGAVRERALPPKLLAVDLPSGLNADTGAVDPHTPNADETVTFGLPKVGLYTVPGSLSAGRVQVVDIGIPAAAAEGLPLTLLTEAWTRQHLPRRPLDANKGTFGKLMAVVGSVNYVGAAYLSSASGYRIGAGLVTVALPRSLQLALVPMAPEVTFVPLDEADGGLVPEAVTTVQENLHDYDALVVGCGLGQRPRTQEFVRSLLYAFDASGGPGLVVDADGLNALAADDGWAQRFRAMAVLTPHPGEFARLAQTSVPEVQSNRIQLALQRAKEWAKVIVLKGANTVVATPEGSAMLSPFANPALASAGTGDVLAGTIAGLLAQGLAPGDAAAAGVYLHGRAGELLRQEFGDAGGLAGDLLRLLPAARNEILQGR